MIEAINRPIPAYLYHATFNANLPSIYKHGLLPAGGENSYINFEGADVGVFLATTPKQAYAFVETSENEEIPEEWFEQIVVLKINARKLEPEKIDYDSHINWWENEEKNIYVYKDVIPSNFILEIVDERGDHI